MVTGTIRSCRSAGEISQVILTRLLSGAFSQVGAFPLASPTSKDSALLVTLVPGSYSVQVRSVDTTTGIVLVEVYELP